MWQYNVPTKYQLHIPYGLRNIAQTWFYRSSSLQQGQIKVTPWHCTPTPPNQCPYPVSTSYTLRFLRYSPDKIFKLKVTAARSNQGTKVTPWRCTPTPPNQCPYHVSTSYTLRFLIYSPYKVFLPQARPSRHHGWKQYPLRTMGGCGVKIEVLIFS